MEDPPAFDPERTRGTTASASQVSNTATIWMDRRLSTVKSFMNGISDHSSDPATDLEPLVMRMLSLMVSVQ